MQGQASQVAAVACFHDQLEHVCKQLEYAPYCPQEHAHEHSGGLCGVR